MARRRASQRLEYKHIRSFFERQLYVTPSRFGWHELGAQRYIKDKNSKRLHSIQDITIVIDTTEKTSLLVSICCLSFIRHAINKLTASVLIVCDINFCSHAKDDVEDRIIDRSCALPSTLLFVFEYKLCFADNAVKTAPSVAAPRIMASVAREDVNQFSIKALRVAAGLPSIVSLDCSPKSLRTA